jgi:hypothetical protein
MTKCFQSTLRESQKLNISLSQRPFLTLPIMEWPILDLLPMQLQRLWINCTIKMRSMSSYALTSTLIGSDLLTLSHSDMEMTTSTRSILII